MNDIFYFEGVTYSATHVISVRSTRVDCKQTERGNWEITVHWKDKDPRFPTTYGNSDLTGAFCDAAKYALKEEELKR